MSQSRNIIDEYPMDEMLSSTPQTTVYRSTDPTSGRPVVVKLLTSIGTNGNHVERQHFLRAMGAVQFLRLPAFPELYDFGFTEDQSAFIVMEWIDGVSFADLKGRPAQHLIPLVLQVVEALEALAMGDVFHHNLSPTNIMVTSSGDNETATIIGFGTAAYLTETSAGAAAMLGHSPDSDLFIAPERLEPETAATAPGAQSDLYSLALITTEILGGTLESGDSGGPAVRFKPALREQLGDPDQLETALSGSLQAAPENRTTTYPLLRLALETAVAKPTQPSIQEQADTDSNVTMDEPPPAPTPPVDGISPPPPLPGASPEASALETEVCQPLPPPPPAPADSTGDETVILSPPDDLDDTDPDLEVATQPFDPNKTDPVLQPDLLRPPPIAVQSPPIEATPTATNRPDTGRRKPPLLAIGVAAAVIVTLIVGGGIVVLLRLAKKTQEVPVAEVVQPTPVPPTPAPLPAFEGPTMNAALEEADALLLAGDIEGARGALADLTQETIDTFTDEESELYTGIFNALTGTRLDSAISDLEGGLNHGSIRMLQRAVAGLARFQPSDYTDRPGVSKKLARAQAALELHAQLWKAHDTGKLTEVLELSAAMIKVLPGYSTPFTFRDEAATALEDESDAAALAGDLDEAARLLAPIEAHWPEREGLNRRLTTIASSRELMNTQLAVIEEALSKGWDGDPAAGLAVLRSVSPLPLLEPRFAKTRLLLEEQLAKADAQPPSLELAGDVKPSFKKKRTVVIELVIRDDYRVASAEAFLKKAEASSYSSMALNRTGNTDRYLLEVSPEVHQNQDFVIYFEATDTSGHTARLGEPESPLEFTRKKGLKAIFSK